MSAPTGTADPFEARLADMRAEQRHRNGRRNFWSAHHWPDAYERCVVVRGRPVCRRCAALHPLSLLVAAFALTVGPPWPSAWDPWPVWLLSLPATVVFVGECVGWFKYSARWQTGTTLVAAIAFGRALGAELADPWHPMFWGPIAVFGGLWFFAVVYGLLRTDRTHRGNRAAEV